MNTQTYRIELFGWPRIVAGCRAVEVALCAPATLREVILALGAIYPALGESVLDLEHGTLAEGYIVNVNEQYFTRDTQTAVQPGETLLLLSGMAGG